MDGQPERAMRAGVVVSFLLEGTSELLWKARMTVLPTEDDVCVRIVNEVETSYKVEAVRFEFLHPDVAEVIGYVDGVPQYGEYVASSLAEVGPVVVVSLA